MVAFVRYADRAGLRAPVPTCPGWTVRDLVGRTGQRAPLDRRACCAARSDRRWSSRRSAVDPMEWLRDGAIELVEAITRVAPGVWARRACHQTTLRAVDALAAALGRRARGGRDLDRAPTSRSTASTRC